MAWRCDLCDKGIQSGNKVSHSNRKTRTKWYPNLKSVRAFINGQAQTIKACSRCIRSGKLVRPVKRTYRPATPAA